MHIRNILDQSKLENSEDKKVLEKLLKLGFETNPRDPRIDKVLDEVIPNLNLLKGLEEGRQFKTKISETKNFIEKRKKEIKTKLHQKKLENIKREKVTIFKELRDINESFKSKTNIKEINELRSQRLTKLNKILELSKQQYTIDQSYEKEIDKEFNSESEQFREAQSNRRSRIGFILAQNGKDLGDPVSDKKFAIRKFDSFVEQEKERRKERLESKTKSSHIQGYS